MAKIKLDDPSVIFFYCFAKQLFKIGDAKMTIDESTQFITMPTHFCKITATTDEFI